MIFISLMHHPVYDRRGNIQTSSITTFDIHDLARSSTTYGVERLYLVHPSPLQRQVAERILGFWEVGGGKEWNPFRSQALEVTRVTANLDLAIEDATQIAGEKPVLVCTTAKTKEGQVTFDWLRNNLGRPTMIILGTGWGLSPEIINRCDLLLEPIWGPTEFNHLSVRAAGAIICDRLLGKRLA